MDKSSSWPHMQKGRFQPPTLCKIWGIAQIKENLKEVTNVKKVSPKDQIRV